MLFEDPRKMALIGKAGEIGDLRERVSGSADQLLRFFNAQLPDIIPEGEIIKIFGELARQVGRMYL